MTRKTTIIFAAITVLALLLAGCGGGGEEPAAEGGSATATPGGEQEQEGDGGDTPSQTAGDPVAGEPLFQQNCSACHGEDAKGLPNLGKDLTTSEFVHGQGDQELLEFVKQGRSSSDPQNTTGIAMPPKGGNPALTDQELLDIIAYIRTLEE